MKCPRCHKIEEDELVALAYSGRNVRQLRVALELLVAIAVESELLTTEAILSALPAGLSSEIVTQLPIIFRENDSLDDFLDRTLLRAYEQIRKQTGSHKKAAGVLRTNRISLYRRIARARQRLQSGATA
jgi:transcriptional regulator with PAS, ATPase and Fis domain